MDSLKKFHNCKNPEIIEINNIYNKDYVIELLKRNAVYNMQFGMSPQFMTTAFGGPMKGVMQFKGYIYFVTSWLFFI